MRAKQSPLLKVEQKGVEENIVHILVYQREESCKKFIFAKKKQNILLKSV